MNLTEFKKENFIEENFDIDFWCDAILAWIGKFNNLENERRMLALEKTIQAGGVAWYEYYKSCEAMIDAHNKKQTMKQFADKLLLQQETLPKKVATHEVTTPIAKAPPHELVAACKSFVSEFSELPDPITVKYTIESHDASGSL